MELKRLKLVILSGAGISAESGIATFRDSTGLWENHQIEDVATPQAWHRDPDLVTRFYNMRRQNVLAAKPNMAHIGLVDLEKYFDVTIITQNVDDLHERAGSSRVIHLHGEILKMRCEEDETEVYEIHRDITIDDVSSRGKRLRPDIVWFGEMVPMMEIATEHVSNADVFVVIGTSLNVYPAAGLLHQVSEDASIYIIDKYIPHVAWQSRIVKIEQPATTGVEELKSLLIKFIEEKAG